MTYEDNAQRHHPLQGVRGDKPVRRAVHPGRYGCNVAPDKPRGGTHGVDEGDGVRVLLRVVLRGVAGAARAVPGRKGSLP